MSDLYSTSVVDGQKVYECPGCGSRPDFEAVAVGVSSPCNNDECPVNSWEWWLDD